MFEKRLNKSIYFSILFLTALVVFVIYMIYRQSPDLSQILGYEKSSGFEYWPIHIFIVLICLVCISSVLILIRQIIKFNNVAFTVDREGIHDTFIGITLFAFIIILPVKLIPWSAVKKLENDEGQLHLKINRKEIVASPVAKIIIGLLGYRFCQGSTITDLDENEKSIITTYCHLQPDCRILENIEEETKTGSGYSKGAKVVMIILVIINILFVALTFISYSDTAEMSCSLTALFGSLLGLEGNPAFTEYFEIAENHSIVYFQVDENYLYYIWIAVKTIHIIASLAFVYKMCEKNPKRSAGKISLIYIFCTLLITTAGFTVLQFAVHNRIEANENNIIRSEYGKEDVVITNYKDAEKVRVYILETEDDEGYLAYECAVDVTAKGKTYTFYGNDDTIYEDMEKFISYFAESIIQIDTTYWDTDEFQDYTYSGYEEILDRIYKKEF